MIEEAPLVDPENTGAPTWLLPHFGALLSGYAAAVWWFLKRLVLRCPRACSPRRRSSSSAYVDLRDQ
jgi:hypothetical protein